MSDLFDAEAMYESDYLRFFGVPAEESTIDLVWRLLELHPGAEVLDLCCGHGPIALPLALRGCRVTGVDSSEVFLARARDDADRAGADVDYRHGDMRDLGPGDPAWQNRFDRVVNWSTAFGYFDDDVNRQVLAQIAGVLRPGGRLAMDLNNVTSLLTQWQPSKVWTYDGGDTVVNRYRLDPLTSRLWVDRTVILDGRARDLTFMVRLFGFPEIRDWLVQAGFRDVRACGEDGAPLTPEHRRMVLVATKPA